MDNPLDAPMPSFDPEVTEPVPPKKPRPRPTRKKPAKNKVVAQPLMHRRVKRHKRKARRAKPAVAVAKAAGAVNASFVKMFAASVQIARILAPFGVSDREAILESALLKP